MDRNQEKSIADILTGALHSPSMALDITGISGAERAYLVFRLYRSSQRTLTVLTASAEEAQGFISDLQFFAGTGELRILYFPPYNILPFKLLSYHSETAARRIETLYSLIDNSNPAILVTTVSAAMQKVVPRSELSAFAELVMAGEDIDRNRLVAHLHSGGYEPVTIVEEPGEFCLRGGVLDIYSPGYPDPVRIEQFGDRVDSIRFFSAASQRSRASLDEAIILPAREAIIREKDVNPLVARIRGRASEQNLPVTRIREIVDQVKHERAFPGAESLLPLIYPQFDTLFSYLPADVLNVQVEPAALERAAVEVSDQIAGSYRSALDEDRLCVPPEFIYMDWQGLQATLATRRNVRLKMLPVDDDPGGAAAPRPVPVSVSDNADLRDALQRQGAGEDMLRPLVEWIQRQQEAAHTVLLVCGSPSQADRLVSLLAPYQLHPEVLEVFPDQRATRGLCFICQGRLTSGFVWAEESLAIATGNDIFGAKPRRRFVRRRSPRADLVAFEDLSSGDLVVHEEHGIGRYEGLVKLQVNGIGNDFLLILYKDDDKLYLPVDRMAMIRKYMGVEGVVPHLDKMGGRAWDRTKDRVKRSAEKIAGRLLKIYAVRKVQKGFVFSAADNLLQDFEAGFPYEETPDQRRAFEDVVQDMMAPTPMDRLICGDVGYGKTEVALRASFVAAFNGKQVAVLVPTTVLAEQHYETFTRRFSRYPVTIACLSRFRSLKEQRQIIEEVKGGKIDIVIGTHRLLQRDVGFHDLGLLILDEEQRFGVKHKERLKALRSTVDVLAMTATPVPRTLHLSLMGVRDISIIGTPPEDRQPIITYLSEFNETVIQEAVHKELARKGQIFFIHNTIASIDRIAAKLQHLVPRVRLDVAHGRLSEEALEGVMLRFVNKEIDMLVCTTIVESGLDIPSANTILVNRADRFGLAQMYQLRGRVGRSEEQAYAYLFIPPESTLGRDALKRLKVLMEHSDLGSGFQIAMNDLRIRGGGTILGASQSGHISAVGYDMFLRLMEDAIGKMKGEPVEEPLDPEIRLSIAAYIPEAYISDIDQRLTAYRRLSRLGKPRELTDFKEELLDRFGPPPQEAENLLMKMLLKIFARRCGVKRLDLNGSQVHLHFSEAHVAQPSRLVDLVREFSDRFRLTPDAVMKIRLSRPEAGGPIAQVKNILKLIDQHVSF
ncbi:Transcription-repair coupling factor [Olavius algarvensis associated proteobacterium Delta 3]|nr:Transcription-repair coupling factor [Olavius algarvensis associated proteobacterium Delta 3]